LKTGPLDGSKLPIYELMLNYMESRQIAYVREFCPYFLAAAGAHIINLENRKRAFYTEHGRVPDLRLHIIFVAPPGWAKSFFLKTFLQKEVGLMYDAGFPTTFEGYMTEAAWVGTKKFTPGAGQAQEVEGMASEMRNGIVGVEEFSAISRALGQEHSAGLDAAILNTLDGGDVVKRLAAGPIKYHTDVTLLAATQQTRFDLTSGLGRRLFFIIWNPNDQDIQNMIEAYWRGENVKPSLMDITYIRQRMKALKARVGNVQAIKFMPSVRKNLEGLMHFEIPLFKRFALGYTVMQEGFDTEIKVEIPDNSELKDLIEKAKAWRSLLMADLRLFQVLELLSDQRLKFIDLVKKVSRFGISEMEAKRLIWTLIKEGRIMMDHDHYVKRLD